MLTQKKVNQLIIKTPQCTALSVQYVMLTPTALDVLYYMNRKNLPEAFPAHAREAVRRFTETIESLLAAGV